MSSFMMTMVAALAGELLLLLLVVLLVAWFRSRAAKLRDIRAMRQLVSRIKKARPERETEIGRFLGEQMGMSGESLAQARSAIQRAELVLLKQFASVYKDRAAGAAAQFDIDLVAALSPYYELTGGGEDATATPVPATPSELEALRKENERLSEELSVTMETMSRMLNEYSTMFAGGSTGAAASIGALTAATAAADSVAAAGEAGMAPDVDDEVEVDLDDTVGPGPADSAEADNDTNPAASTNEPNADIEVAFETQAEEPDADAEGAVAETTGPDAEVVAEASTADDEETADFSDEPVDVGSQIDDPAVSQDTDVEQDVSQGDIDALFAMDGHEDLVDETDQGFADSVTLDEPEPVPEAALQDSIAADQDSVAEVSEVAPSDAVGSAEVDTPEDVADPTEPVYPPPLDGGPDELTAGQVAEAPAVEIEPGDDLETVTDFFEEGAAEVVAFDESDDFDVELAVSADELFDPVDPETIVRADAALDELLDDVEETDADDLFDVADRPLRTQSAP